MADPELAPKKVLTKVPLGPTGKTVATNVKRLMEAQNLGFTDVIRKLEVVKRPIPMLGLRKIVAETRRVDVDDLVALAAVLGVSPITLLTPNTSEPDEAVVTTGVEGELTAEELWNWMRADKALPAVAERSVDTRMQFLLAALPHWRAKQYMDGLQALMEVNQLDRELKAGGDRAEIARRRLDEIGKEIGT